MAVTHVGSVGVPRIAATIDATPDFSGVSWAAGDYAICVLTSDASLADAIDVVPTGWLPWPGTAQSAANYLANPETTADPGRCWCYVKFLAGGEDTTPTWHWASHEDGQAVLSIFRGVDTTTPIATAARSFKDSPSATTHTSTAIDATINDGCLVSFAFVDAATVVLADPWTPPTGMTQGAEMGESANMATTASGTYTTSAYETYTTAPGSGITRTWTLNTAADIAGIYMMALSPAAGGGGTGPALNANITQMIGQTFRLRMEVQETAGTAISQNFQWWYSKNGGAYAQITSSTDIRPALSAQFADGDATTAKLATGTGTFIAGAGDENGAVAAISIPASGRTEIEGAFVLAGAAANGDTFDIRLRRSAGTVLDSYTRTPRVTAVTPQAISRSPATMTFDWAL